VLVAIASYGERNLEHLKEVIARYQGMATLDLEVIVTSEAPKRLPAGVSISVGLPSSNPRSLPFAHKKIFADKIEEYDLFIYSEDDIGVTEAQVHAFLRTQQLLREDEVVGFLRYESNASVTATRWMPDVHNFFRWKPESVVHRGDLMFAEYTNEHAAFYILSRDQLRKAIRSGGFLREPDIGKYSMLETAATDPYTRCGLRKLICISRLEDFLIHHMSNRYTGQMGMALDEFTHQIDTLRLIDRGDHPATTLCAIETTVPELEWSKSLYEEPHGTLLSAIPPTPGTMLSIGCGRGLTEAQLINCGWQVTALPLDSVIGAAAAKLGISAVYGSLSEAPALLKGRRFDCVLITNLLHLQSDPRALFDMAVGFVREGGAIVIDSPNFSSLRIATKRAFGDVKYKMVRTYSESGITTLSARTLARYALEAGFGEATVRWYEPSLRRRIRSWEAPLPLGRLTAKGWVLRAIRLGNS